MAMFNETKITKQGHELLAKVLSGKCQLHFEELWAGDGHYDGDVWDLTELVNPRLQGSILEINPMGLFSELQGLITNQKLTSVLEFRELGVKAADPDLGLILFAYTNAGDTADYIGPFNGVFLTEEQFTMRIYTANVAEISATIETTSSATQIIYNNTYSGLDAGNIQDAIDELYNKLHEQNAYTHIATVEHGLGILPDAVLYAGDFGYGVGGYGEGPYGGSSPLDHIDVKLHPIDRNRVRVYVPERFAGYAEVRRISKHEFALSKAGSTTTLTLKLLR